MPKLKTKKLDCAKRMPKLYHSKTGDKFAVHKSEVVNWLIMQPSILNYIFEKARNTKLIRFNKETRKWQGV